MDERHLVALKEEVSALKEKLSDRVLILGHHYQRPEIIEFSDFVGDSYILAKTSSESMSKYIIFCGVRFMAESAAILCRDEQKVLHPDRDAGCPLAEMADIDKVKKAWDEIADITDIKRVVPVTYINSQAELKAFCGINDGVICTSSNAGRAFDWGFSRGEKLFFFPDQHLGRNTGYSKGLKGRDVVLWNPLLDSGGLSPDAIRAAKVILWNGFCHVHTVFNLEDVTSIRKRFPGISIIVHPECTKEVVEASDAAGSTSFIVDYVKNAPSGSSIAIGTEINLVSRLANTYADKRIVELKRSLCPNMYRITLDKLATVLKKIETFEPVRVDHEIKKDARMALGRMLEI